MRSLITNKRKKILLIILMVFGILFVVCSIVGPRTEPPSDEILIKNFNDNKKIFQQLKTMIIEDGYSVISYDPRWTDPEGIQATVTETYHELLKKINVKQIRMFDNGTVVFPVWGYGWAGGGDYKGYTYKPTRTRQAKESLDGFISTGVESFNKRDIGDDWILFYDHFP